MTYVDDVLILFEQSKQNDFLLFGESKALIIHF